MKSRLANSLPSKTTMIKGVLDILDQGLLDDKPELQLLHKTAKGAFHMLNNRDRTVPGSLRQRDEH